MNVWSLRSVAEGADVNVTRDESAAKLRAEDLRAKIVDGETFSDLSQANDKLDEPLQAKLMGRILGQVLELEPGSVAPLIRTESGYVVAQRCPLAAV